MEDGYSDELELPSSWSEKCVCGKSFHVPGSYTNHIRACPSFRQRLGKRIRSARTKRQGTIDSDLPQVVDPRGEKRAEARPSARKRQRTQAWCNEDELDIDMAKDDASIPLAQPPDDQARVPVEPVHVEEVIPEPEEPEVRLLGRGHRIKRLSSRIQQTHFQPSSTLPISLFPAPPQPPPPAPNSPIDQSTLDGEQVPAAVISHSTPPPSFTTRPNRYGLYKVYTLPDDGDIPHDPDHSISPEDLRDEQRPPVVTEHAQTPPSDPTNAPPNFGPFPNLSSFLIGEWFWDDANGKSQESFQRLVDIIGDPDFVPSDVGDANWTKINALLAASEFEKTEGQGPGDNISWKSTAITIHVPFTARSASPGVHSFTVEGFHHRPLIPLIRGKLESKAGLEYFHTMGYDLRWRPGPGKDARVYGEMYHSEAFRKAVKELEASPKEPGCTLPRFVIALMFASDATMLASYGTAKAWPVYIFFGNDSKYRRGKPSEKLFDVVAYLEKLPDEFKEFLTDRSGSRTVSTAYTSHCNREMFHEQLKIIFDDEFVDAYCHGIVVTGYDGKQRRGYPRIMTWSADYPKKALLATIKNMGLYPCPRCKIPMDQVKLMGQKRDSQRRKRLARHDDEDRRNTVAKARTQIYSKGRPLTSKIVGLPLAIGSLVPTENALSSRLSEHGFDLFPMLVVDLMHEVELGVWKSLFLHLLRIIDLGETGTVNKLDRRFRDMPTFGKDTIRRFVNNVSETKQFAARNYEDILQCAIPAFEGLLPAPHGRRVTQLLFTFATWHGLAKLRLHTDHTLALLESETTKLGKQMRDFMEKTCAVLDTKELKKEYEARKRKETRQKSKGMKQSHFEASEAPIGAEVNNTDGRRSKTFSLNTYKYHSLGDVPETIRMFGTSESYSTQMPESFHRYPKMHYQRTSKKDVGRQLSRIQMRQARIKKLREQIYPPPDEGFADEESFQLPYFIGKSQSNPINLPAFIRSNINDPAAEGFFSKLRNHLLPRVYQRLIKELSESPDRDLHDNLQERIAHLEMLHSGAKSLAGAPDQRHEADLEADVNRLFFHGERIYQHQLMYINYTTYDVRRDTDVINPKTSRRDVMCLRRQRDGESVNDDNAVTHSFVYARVLGIFHANVVYQGKGALDLRKRRFDFLWVRWYDFCEEKHSDSSLDRLQFLPVTNSASFGFLDPDDVTRASHIIPRFDAGKKYNPVTDASKRSSPIHSKVAKDVNDWQEYCVNRFVDRDMLLRYFWGYGVGHVYSHADAPAGGAELLERAPECDDDDTSGSDDDDTTEERQGGQVSPPIDTNREGEHEDAHHENDQEMDEERQGGRVSLPTDVNRQGEHEDAHHENEEEMDDDDEYTGSDCEYASESEGGESDDWEDDQSDEDDFGEPDDEE